ncbi:MAG: hypothetical protein HY868_00625 [Chloroflexi bacterium]|nr:hypothetical protein [Chloroflexota bacterium]
MTHTYTADYRIRQYELNSREELSNAALARLFQETAMRGSADAGFGIEWYAAHKSVWVVHRLTLEHHRPIRYGDELAITTWISDVRRVFSHREYLARNAATNEIVACGRANWLHLDPTTMMPARVPQYIAEQLAPNGIAAVTRDAPRAYALPAHIAPRECRVTRRVQRYEIDGMQHVNNAVYVDWLEETLAEATADLMSPARQLCVRRHDIEYLHGALPGEEIAITARLTGAGNCASAWSLQVTRGDQVLVRDHVTAFWRDENGKSGKWRVTSGE